jgi:predicted dehydrogenase
MASTGSLGVGIVGYGLAGRFFHAPFIAAVDGLHVAAIATSRADRQAEVKREHPGAAVVESFDDLLERSDVEIVVVASPNRTHVPLGVQALKSGRHVVVDKPIATDITDATRLVEVAAQTGKVLSVYHNRRFDGDFLTVRSLVSEGTLGPIDSMESRFEIGVPLAEAWREDADEAGGPHRDLGAHLVDQALLLFGDPVRVFAQLDRRRPGTEVDDSAFVALEHRGGERSRIWTSLISPWGRPRFRLRGLLGEFVKEERDPQEARAMAGGLPSDPGFGVDEPEQWGRLYLFGEEPRTVPTVDGDYRRFYELFRDAVRTGSPPPVDPRDAIRGLRVLEAAETSSRTGSVVSPAPV